MYFHTTLTLTGKRYTQRTKSFKPSVKPGRLETLIKTLLLLLLLLIRITLAYRREPHRACV